MLGTAVVLALGQGDDLAVPPWLIPLIIYSAAVVLVWSPLDAVVAADARRPDVVSLVSRDAWLRIVIGWVAAAFAVWLFAISPFTTSPLVRTWVVVGVAMVATALLLAPWWLRLIRQVTVERERRVREFERAEIAAHLHDSVLQTLTLIRAHATEPETVARLARAQERDLRAYLYQERRSPSESVAAALTAAINEVEDALGTAIEVVTVGDVPTTPALAAAVSAAREAATNAARHGVGPISVYAEVTPGGYEVFVRDAGPGFDPEAVSEDRLGIRNSIVGRVRRAGGDASVKSAPGEPTEVTISVPREEQK
jgi:signal transduction histidine kinase